MFRKILTTSFLSVMTVSHANEQLFPPEISYSTAKAFVNSKDMLLVVPAFTYYNF